MIISGICAIIGLCVPTGAHKEKIVTKGLLWVRTMNTSVFRSAKWIWHKNSYGENEYGEFFQKVFFSGNSAVFRISVCGDYTLFINGKYVASNQYGDFPHYKVYDEIDITDFLVTGENTICILAWYFGKFGMRHYTPVPGLIFEIDSCGKIIGESSEATLSRKSKAYKSNADKKISVQLGFSFSYDATKEDDWRTGGGRDFAPSVIAEIDCALHKRPIKKHILNKPEKGVIAKTATGYLVDFGGEIVGLPVISFTSKKEQSIIVSYGELLENGRVKRLIGDRDFSFDYFAKAGKNEYTNYMFRCALRYFEIECDEPLDIDYIGIIPQCYPATVSDFEPEDALDKKIYEICINTLKLCMMEHYVDCPWREQCMYAFDSRNQMLSGYYAFSDSNFDYARANLLLMGKDSRDDNLLSICFPSASDLTIPSFSLYYILAVKEYLDYSGDLTLAEEVFPKFEKILNVFLENTENGLVCKFEGENRWNFYDWSPYAMIRRGQAKKEPDFLLNAIVIIGLTSYAAICERLGRVNPYKDTTSALIKRVRDEYYNPENGLFFIHDKSEEPTELANSLAVFSGIATGDIAEKICEKLSSKSLLPCSLSMKPFKYDALLMVNKEKYKDAVLREIRDTYKVMLKAGSTTVWETIEGATAFENAGSLCHGWSAIPVYYYHLFEKL